MKSDPGVKIKKVFDIGLDQEGKVHVNGPIANKLFCIAILNDAMSAVLAHKESEPSRIITNAIHAVPGNGDRL